jgi:hypothetical protein
MTAQIHKCFIASPGDTIKEREICTKIINEINRSIGQSYNFRIDTLKWEENTRPSVGEYSQKIISEQIGNDYDIFIGIMYKKFGTKTKSADSGTEEEFNNAYDKYKKSEDVEIMFYFNDEPTKLSQVDTDQYEKVKLFKRKIADLGVYYWNYDGFENFEENLRNHLYDYFLNKYNNTSNSSHTESLKDSIRKILSNRLNESLSAFSDQPLVWTEPVLSRTNDISENPNENFERRIEVEDFIDNVESTIIKAPPQFGLTCLTHYLIKQAWEKDKLWAYINFNESKEHNVHKKAIQNIRSLGLEDRKIDCIILDSWNIFEKSAFKILKNLSNEYPDIPIIVMETIDDSKFNNEVGNENIGREFKTAHLLALPRTQIRKVVSDYNKSKGIGEEDVVLNKVISDLECLNIHRTPMNCLTLLKVSEKYFDESPVNRTQMLEMVLFVLFNMDGIPKYKTKPDLKDTEYVLGRFCEELIRDEKYEFTREYFLEKLKEYCSENLLDLEVEIVFDVLINNNILTKRDVNYLFRSSFWIYYFAAKRMHTDKDFSDYIFNSGKYVTFPEIIEFYTGIDRNRDDAVIKLLADLKETCDLVNKKVGIPDNVNPLLHAKWHPDEKQIEKMEEEVNNTLQSSNLPDNVKDQVADRNYNQIRPYDQSIQNIFKEYSLHTLMQQIKATSRALRNSDYISPELKIETLREIQRSWEQVSKVLFALSPVLATKGRAAFGGIGFILSDDFGSTFKDRLNMVLQVNPTNVVGFFKEDIYSSKMGPLLFEEFKNEENALKKHFLALLIVFEKPRNWKKEIENYIISLHKNSFFLFDTINNLKAKYRYGFLKQEDIGASKYLIKMGIAKNHFGDKKPGLHKIQQINNKVIPKREE